MLDSKRVRNNLLFLLSFCSNILYAQKDTSIKYGLSFYKFNNPGKIKKLRYGDQIKVILFPTPIFDDKHLVKDNYGDYVMPDSTSVNITYTGILNAKTDSSLSIDFTSKNIVISEYYADTDSQYKYNKEYLKKGDLICDGPRDSSNICKRDTIITITDNCPTFYNVGRNYNTDINYYDDSVLNISLRKVNYITFNRPGNFTDNDFNVIILSASCISALVVAPAVSISYSHENFNTHRYFNVMVPSLALFSCDLTLYLIMNRERKYKVRLGVR